MYMYIGVGILCSGFIFWRIVSVIAQRGARSLESVKRYCDAGNALTFWCMNNPELYIGDHDIARGLVLQYIAAINEFLHYHPYCDFEEHIKLLYALLNQHGPEPPRKPWTKDQNSRSFGCFLHIESVVAY